MKRALRRHGGSRSTWISLCENRLDIALMLLVFLEMPISQVLRETLLSLGKRPGANTACTTIHSGQSANLPLPDIGRDTGRYERTARLEAGAK